MKYKEIQRNLFTTLSEDAQSCYDIRSLEAFQEEVEFLNADLSEIEKKSLIGKATRWALANAKSHWKSANSTYEGILGGKTNFVGATLEQVDKYCKDDLKEYSQSILDLVNKNGIKINFAEERFARLRNYSQGNFN